MTTPVENHAPTHLRNYINGEFVDAKSGRFSDVIDPCTGEAYLQAPISGPEDVDAAYAAAAAAFESWSQTTPGERANLLLKVADAIEARAEELNEAECLNTGKPRARMAEDETPIAADHFRFFAGAARTLEGPTSGEFLADHTSMIRYEPIGVVGQVTPWNYPMMMAVWKIAPAIAAGNTVVLKPSDTTPVSTMKLAEIIGEVLPTGVFNVVAGDRETGALVVGHPTAQMVAITGSVGAGMAVAKSRGRRPQAGPPGARRQGPGRRLRRRHRPQGAPPRPSPGPVSTTPARTARRPAACWSTRASTTSSWPRSPRRPRTP